MPDRIGKYNLRQILGKGAMGIVYEGFDPIIGRRLAIKTVRIPDQDDLEAQDELARFKREAQAAGRLTHPNIVGVFDYGETTALAYIVMEFVDGTTLKQLLDRNERFPLAEIVRIMRGLLDGLHYSHERGVVHRDIKPANVMLTQSGEVKIADFGIARIESSSLTQAGTMMGTPSYMSPEQFIGQTVDSRTDIYSAGVVLYQLLTGEKPFEGGLTAIMHKVLHTEPPPPSKLSVTVPNIFDTVVQKAMAKRPLLRFASASEFATALQDAFENKTEMQVGPLAAELVEDDATLVVAARSVAPATFPSSTPAGAASTSPSPAAKPFPKLAVAGGAGALVILAISAFLLIGHNQPAPAIPSPAPALAVTVPAPAVAPHPSPQPMTAAQRDATLQSIFGTLPCTLIGAVNAGGKLRLTGIAGAGAPQAAFTAALNSPPAGVAPQPTVQTFDGPYCAVLDAIRPYNVFLSKPGAELGLGLAGGISILHDGQLMTVKEKMPAYAGYLQTDYFSGDGTVRHLYPTATDPLTKLPAESRKVLGNPKKGGASWKVSAPYGAYMIISIVTTAPLFPNLRPPDESASDYLPALRLALHNAASNNPNLDVAAVQLITEPKQ
jgi:eukaryotic-like serine/threonine-protein kinase